MQKEWERELKFLVDEKFDGVKLVAVVEFVQLRTRTPELELVELEVAVDRNSWIGVEVQEYLQTCDLLLLLRFHCSFPTTCCPSCSLHRTYRCSVGDSHSMRNHLVQSSNRAKKKQVVAEVENWKNWRSRVDGERLMKVSKCESNSIHLRDYGEDSVNLKLAVAVIVPESIFDLLLDRDKVEVLKSTSENERNRLMKRPGLEDSREVQR